MTDPASPLDQLLSQLTDPLEKRLLARFVEVLNDPGVAESEAGSGASTRT